MHSGAVVLLPQRGLLALERAGRPVHPHPAVRGKRQRCAVGRGEPWHCDCVRREADQREAFPDRFAHCAHIGHGREGVSAERAEVHGDRVVQAHRAECSGASQVHPVAVYQAPAGVGVDGPASDRGGAGLYRDAQLVGDRQARHHQGRYSCCFRGPLLRLAELVRRDQYLARPAVGGCDPHCPCQGLLGAVVPDGFVGDLGIERRKRRPQCPAVLYGPVPAKRPAAYLVRRGCLAQVPLVGFSRMRCHLLIDLIGGGRRIPVGVLGDELQIVDHGVEVSVGWCTLAGALLAPERPQVGA